MVHWDENLLADAEEDAAELAGLKSAVVDLRRESERLELENTSLRELLAVELARTTALNDGDCAA